MTMRIHPALIILISFWVIIVNYSEAKLGAAEIYQDLFGNGDQP